MFGRMAAYFMLVGVVMAPPAATAQSRPLAPGVLTIIPVVPEYEETASGPLGMVEIVTGLPELDWDPQYSAKSATAFERAKLVTLRRDIWNLEFSFKPLRMITVDVPQPSGKMQKKLIWYMVYRVRYLGGDLRPDPVKDDWGHETYQAIPSSREGRHFFPQFFLESHDVAKVYLDRIIPAAKAPIEERELSMEQRQAGVTLLNTVEISSRPVSLSTPDDPKEAWGLVTWEDVDPYIDFFSVLIKGLTNAYKPVDVPGVFKQGDEPGAGRQFLAKSLQLNFWRPGDAVNENETEIRFGVPYSPDPERQAGIIAAYGLKSRLDYLWIYR
ncbi:MAG: hypothetical protein FJ276_08425 [Planctomycetes bacterium]|nr:hypothetical protein [Planctomycetota bacterium]